MTTRLAGYVDVACSHVFAGASATCERTLETRESSCVPRTTRPFFIYLMPTAHWGARDAWQHWDPPWLGVWVQSHRTCDSVEAHLSREVMSEAI
jgi:hypothetical protein